MKYFGHQPLDALVTALVTGSRRGQVQASVPHTGQTLAILRILAHHGLISGYKPLASEHTVSVDLRYVDGIPAISALRRVSKSRKRVYLRAQGLDTAQAHWHLKILSTDQGILTHTQAWAHNLGGEYLLEVNGA